jgi:cytochrome P450
MPEPERRFDLYGDDFKRDPHATFASMRREAPIWQQAGLDGTTPIWFVTRYADVDAMLRDKRFVRDAALAHDAADLPQEPELFRRIGQHMLNRDGADHQRLRGLVSQAFTPRRVAEMRPRIRTIAAGLLEPLVSRGSMELIGDFAFPLPTTVILEMLGVPIEDRDRVRIWGNALLAAPRDAGEGRLLEAQLVEFGDYVAALVEDRRTHPRDDLLSGLVAAEEAGDRLSLDELLSTLVLLITAGHETTVNLIANAVLALSRHPQVRDALAADPAALPAAVEEFLRFDGPVERALNRWAAEDVVWAGRTIRRGEPLILILGSANRDPERFDGADTLDPGRNPNPHLAFGKGPHYCLGAPLARLEGEIALEALLARLPRLRVAVPEAELRYRFLPGFRALEALPVAWDVPG